MLPYGLAIGCMKNHPGSVADIQILSRNIHQRVLPKLNAENDHIDYMR